MRRSEGLATAEDMSEEQPLSQSFQEDEFVEGFFEGGVRPCCPPRHPHSINSQYHRQSFSASGGAVE